MSSSCSPSKQLHDPGRSKICRSLHLRANRKWAPAADDSLTGQLCSQLFVLFDLKKNNVVEFSEFVRALSVFHPKAPLEEKAECECSRLECCSAASGAVPIRCEPLTEPPRRESPTPWVYDDAATVS